MITIAMIIVFYRILAWDWKNVPEKEYILKAVLCRIEKREQGQRRKRLA